jgi:hypothetical protein
VGDGLKGSGTSGLNLSDYPDYRVVEALSGLLVGSNHQGRSLVTISTSTQTNPSGLRSGECGLGSFRNQLTFTLCYQGQNSHGETVHVGTIAADKVDSRVLETKKELRVAAQTIKFCNHQSSFGPFALIESCVELRAVVKTTALDLREFVKYVAFLAQNESGDCVPLSVHSVSVVSLMTGGDPEVGDVLRHMAATTNGAQAIKGHLKGLNDRRGAANSTLRPSKQVSGHRFDLRTETGQRLLTTPLRTNR